MRAVQRRRHAHSRMNVRRAADDLNRLFAAHIHHADVQMIGIRMINAGNYLADDHLVELLARVRYILDRRAGHDHLRGVFFGGQFNVHIFFQPFHRDFHFVYPPSLAVLRQEPQVVFIQIAQVRNIVFQQRDALYAHAERESRILL